jgi:hypothetical protein
MTYKVLIYSNPSLPVGLYYCKCLDLKLVPSGDSSYLWILLLTGPSYQECAGQRLNSILHLTDASASLVKKFRKTFRIQDDEFSSAIGRWGCVSVFDNTWCGTKFSNVAYVKQTALMKKASLELEEGEKNGLLEWENPPNMTV